MSKRVGPPPNVRAAEITKLLHLRYASGVIENDRKGHDRLRALLDHIVQMGDARRLRRALGWSPWLSEADANSLLDRCVTLRQAWAPDELGTLFDLTADERAALKITTIRPAGYSDADMEALRRAGKAEYSQKYRARKAVEAREHSRAAADDKDLSERDRAVFCQTLPVWRSTTDIAGYLAKWPEFRKSDFASIRKAVIRACKTLIAGGWLDGEMRSGNRRQKLLFVRRSEPRFPAVHAVFVSETTGTSRKPHRSETAAGRS